MTKAAPLIAQYIYAGRKNELEIFIPSPKGDECPTAFPVLETSPE
ncbi:MAG: hypothetical protein ONB05_06385 [candidate division KSB1 bacterium]|nr:hypothetical protein [candidate division KSB1 bacterium]